MVIFFHRKWLMVNIHNIQGLQWSKSPSSGLICGTNACAFVAHSEKSGYGQCSQALMDSSPAGVCACQCQWL